MRQENPEISCENNFCLYWKEDFCTLTDIALDRSGHCLECEWLPLDENVLDHARTEMELRTQHDVYHHFYANSEV